MTVRGDTQRPWTEREVSYLLDTAGRIPSRDIARHLGRSMGSIEHKVARLRGEGIDITLRCAAIQLVWCPDCARWRTHISPITGRCRVCDIRHKLERCETACAEMRSRMTQGQRDTYERTDGHIGTRKMPGKPKRRMPVDTCSLYERTKAEAERSVELEAWEAKCMQLRYDAARQRSRRMKKALKNGL